MADKATPKTFEQLKPQIIEVINQRLATGKLGIPEPVTLIDGFASQSLGQEAWAIVLWWVTIPMIMLVGTDSWRLYFFALKHLIPESF